MGEVLEVGGRRVDVTNRDKPLWRDAGVTKGDLIDYYRRIAPLLLPHVAGRPLTLVRAPEGVGGPQWFHKDAGGSVPDWVRTARLGRWERGAVDHVVADEPATLAVLGQLASVELHAGPSPVADLDHPRTLLIDLDPPGRRDREVRRAARLVRDLVTDELGLPTYINSTGSKGFHVRVPLDGSADVAVVQDTARGIAEVLASRHPDLLTVERRTAERGGRIYVDWARHHPANTSIAPYSPRAREGAPVAMPLGWDELARGIAPDRHQIRSVFRRLGQRNDPWGDLSAAASGLDGARRTLAAIRPS